MFLTSKMTIFRDDRFSTLNTIFLGVTKFTFYGKLESIENPRFKGLKLT